ncbi:heme anaerobic degradation radical SAM methyltransferase ChuW/HutW [Agarivorans sp. TSD2052]|uniref:heme anaerobic degradation radical SAM methyltransferase ChuW/HutW n=1 Tax=Agarivorans sp. TSD2052 TaxID=2937286 RepID=UPI00200E169E|nr:heme anaerobic degradation radical SAM methyltransferase ChuW/HutW [Agarivorans sp. TSD2052]UPW19929.1 heme anaerobic degradation radical SAM methyltransferase ChuW/HutW [Agarivorans sp. TSD2052]
MSSTTCSSNIVLPEIMTGQASPSPLQFAFTQKTAAHAKHGQRKTLTGDEAHRELRKHLDTPATSLRPRAIYIHVPFCRVRCSFCNFFQYASSQQMMDDYFKLLEQELIAKSQYAWSQAKPFDAVYVGGGTPTDLTAEQLLRLGKLIRRYFSLTTLCEITLEGRLNRFTDDKFQAALDGGFNRFSFGVQSFNSTVRKAAKRLDKREYILERLHQLTDSGSATIAIDLIYGLPHQTPENWQQDLQDVVSSGVHGVDLYQLLTFGGSGLQRNIDAGRANVPLSTSDKALMYQQGHQFFKEKAFSQLSYCHWASHPREQSRYNSLAKQGAEILPIGAGAGGNINGYGLMQARNIDSWRTGIEHNHWSFEQLSLPAANAELTAAITSACDRGVIKASAFTNGQTLFKQCQPLFEAWKRNGLVSTADDQVKLSLAGQFWSVNLANAMSSYIQQYTSI